MNERITIINSFKSTVGERKNGIDRLNHGLKDKWSILILAIIILIMGIWQSEIDNGTGNPYWKYMKFPFILLYVIIIFRYVLTNKKLSENISETEKLCAL